ncbi:unnamed protein product [Calicophoron daubneyi]|uniref:Uncharacterized protein n=1 Tax=Calicophoron daubneyi TaxID=300641 RepID=A0AAV2TD53_CALDB
MIAMVVRSELDEKCKRPREVYTSQMSELRGEVDSKHTKTEELKGKVHKLEFQGNKSDGKLKRLLKDCEDKSARSEVMEKAAQKQEQAKQDLRALEETVVKEHQTLHSLRHPFFQNMNNHIRTSAHQTSTVVATVANNNTGIQSTHQPAGQNQQNALNMVDSGEDEWNRSGSAAQRENILSLENSLDKLGKVNRRLFHDNEEVRCQLSKLEVRLKCAALRVHCLELSLKQAKQGAMWDRERYQVEVERIKGGDRQRNATAPRRRPSIAKPIRGGHVPTTVSR